MSQFQAEAKAQNLLQWYEKASKDMEGPFALCVRYEQHKKGHTVKRHYIAAGPKRIEIARKENRLLGFVDDRTTRKRLASMILEDNGER